MIPFLWLLIGAGIGTSATLLVKRASENTLLPGQVWTLVVLAHQTKMWAEISKGDVARAIRAALTNVGAIPIDAYWSADYQLTVAVSVMTTTQLKTGTVLTLGSEWADQATITSINQAPASVPVQIPRFP
jgi:hypothetical protein